MNRLFEKNKRAVMRELIHAMKKGDEAKVKDIYAANLDMLSTASLNEMVIMVLQGDH